MPTYEFKCKRCNGEYQAVRPMKESTKPWKCPSCKVDCIRIIGQPTNFILKGDGWPGKELKNGNK